MGPLLEIIVRLEVLDLLLFFFFGKESWHVLLFGLKVYFVNQICQGTFILGSVSIIMVVVVIILFLLAIIVVSFIIIAVQKRVHSFLFKFKFLI